MTSIRSTLLMRLSAWLAAVLSLAVTLLFFLVRGQLNAQFDDQLIDKARLLASSVRQEGDEHGQGQRGLEMELGETPIPEFGAQEPSAYFDIRDGARSVFRSASLGALRLDEQEAGSKPLFWNTRLPDGRSGRAVLFTFVPASESRHPLPTLQPVLAIQLARERQSLDHSLQRVAAALGAFGLMLLLAVPLVVSKVVPSGLGPLLRLARDIQSIDAQSLSHRLLIDGMPSELLPIATRLNELLGRLEASFIRERRFSADVAHELRTPIAELRTLSEVALGTFEADPSTLSKFREVVEISLQMERVVVGLLTLARSESKHQVLAKQNVNVGNLLQGLWQARQAAAMIKGLRCTWASVPCSVLANQILLETLLTNLLDNAICHGDEGGIVEIGWHNEGTRVGVAITNANSSLNAKDLESVFDRFWRKDSARTDGTHSGLGLAIAAAAAQEMGGQLVVERLSPATIRFTLWVPCWDKTV